MQRGIRDLLRVGALLASIAPGGLTAIASELPPPIRQDLQGGWHEALVSVSDLDRTATFFTRVAGWVEVDRGTVDATTLTYFGLDPAATHARYRVIRPMDFPQGWVRLIQYDRPGHALRSNAQAWDTGGIFSLMTRSRDATRNLADAEQAGWSAYSEPYDFEFGDLALRNLVLRGPDGLNVAVYEWRRPALPDAPPPGTLSKAFNAMQMVRDIDAAKDFYQRVLGFAVIQCGEFIDPEPRATNFALPVNYATRIPRAYCIMSPAGADRAAGRVELMAFPGFEGRDLSQQAEPLARGILSLRFPSTDLDARIAALRAGGAEIVFGPGRLEMPPFFAARAVTVRTPDGAWLTWFQPEPSAP